jgi:hypothetical protein
VVLLHINYLHALPISLSTDDLSIYFSFYTLDSRRSRRVGVCDDVVSSYIRTYPYVHRAGHIEYL